MDNATLSSIFERIAKLKELNGENAFAAANYNKAALVTDRLMQPADTLGEGELEAAYGKKMAGLASSWLKLGSAPELIQLESSIPSGVLRMLEVPGFGVKKVSQLWRTHGIDTFELLIEMAQNGEMAKLAGFGAGTQARFLEHLESAAASEGKMRLGRAWAISEALQAALVPQIGVEDVVIVGQAARYYDTIDRAEVLVALHPDYTLSKLVFPEAFILTEGHAQAPFSMVGSWLAKYDVTIHACSLPELHARQILLTGPDEFLLSPTTDFRTVSSYVRRPQGKGVPALPTLAPASEYDLLEGALGFYLEPELRDAPQYRPKEGQTLLAPTDIKGILHCHSTYSDGTATLEQMARAVMEQGYEYFGIADHSQTATYANGLDLDKLNQQWDEIDRLNETLAPFRILKGIESDILPNGDLDYPDTVLVKFDYIVASVHANLKMSEEKAMERLLRAVENPYTTILGHPSGRLILKREGYPLEYDTLLARCVERNVVVELNASPHRLDLDWRLIPLALQHGVKIAINPDAHSINGLSDMRYGIGVGRKAGLTAPSVLNTLSLSQMQTFLKSKQPK
jgi:DNA polymerase (family X)